MNNLTEELKKIEQLVQDIINQPSGEIYNITNHGGGLMNVQPSTLTNRIMLTVNFSIHPLLQCFKIYEYNPYVNVFIYNVDQCGLLSVIRDYAVVNKNNNLFRAGLDFEFVLGVLDSIKGFIDKIKFDVSRVEFKKSIYNANRVMKNNQDGLYRYIDSLFERYSKLLVVRLDLGYRSNNFICTDEDISTKYWEAKTDLKHFLKNTKMNGLFNHVVGYVWSLEYGPDKGYHFHMILFFDGAKVRQDVTIGKMIGDYWVSIITGGRGVYYNCNANKDGYIQCGIGEVGWNDIEKRIYLKNAAAYLTKVDHYARLLTPDYSRTFGRGEVLHSKIGGPGRPRVNY